LELASDSASERGCMSVSLTAPQLVLYFAVFAAFTITGLWIAAPIPDRMPSAVVIVIVDVIVVALAILKSRR